MRLSWPAPAFFGLTLVWSAVALAQQSGTAPSDSRQPPPVSSDPQLTTAAFGDWVLRCQRTGDGQTQHICEVGQTLQVQGQGPIAQIALGRLGPKDPLRLTIVVPPNVSFPSSVRLSVDEADTQPADLAWRRCLPGGCVADSEIKDDILRRWRPRSDRGRLQFKSGDGRDVVLPFSFRGLAQALDALAKA